ncbi:MAG: hypothetical protein C0391_03860 [Anaerolinea sp.]|nr:hypothetical protein [Anaerolinea sp.]
MTVEKLKQLELEGIASQLETPEDDPREISDAARERFEQMVAGVLASPQPPPNNPSDVFGEGANPEEWFSQYLELAKAGFKWRVAAYIAWASSPKIDRWPKTQNQFATQILGLTSDRVIITWRQKNPSIDSTIGQLQSQPLFAHRADIFDALIESASNPNYKNHQDRKLALEMLGDYSPKIKIEDERKGSGQEDYSEISDDELTEKVLAAKHIKANEVKRQPETGEANESD